MIKFIFIFFFTFNLMAVSNYQCVQALKVVSGKFKEQDSARIFSQFITVLRVDYQISRKELDLLNVAFREYRNAKYSSTIRFNYKAMRPNDSFEKDLLKYAKSNLDFANYLNKFPIEIVKTIVMIDHLAGKKIDFNINYFNNISREVQREKFFKKFLELVKEKVNFNRANASNLEPIPILNSDVSLNARKSLRRKILNKEKREQKEILFAAGVVGAGITYYLLSTEKN